MAFHSLPGPRSLRWSGIRSFHALAAPVSLRDAQAGVAVPTYSSMSIPPLVGRRLEVYLHDCR